MRVLCIYHKNCADGFGAAWVLHHYFRNKPDVEIEFFAGTHQDPPPEADGRLVVFVDFSYKKPVMLEFLPKTSGILVLDHHKSAIEDLEPDHENNLFAVTFTRKVHNWEHWLDVNETYEPPNEITCIFDMTRSGAGLTWDFFFPTEKRPRLIDHIEDRDLWKFAIPDTRAIQDNLFSYPYNFAVWDDLIKKAETHDGIVRMIEDGVAISRKHFKDVEELISVVTRPMKFRVPFDEGESTWVVPMANLPYTMTSDAGHALCADHDYFGQPVPGAYQYFAGCYWDTPEGRVFSLRSRPDGFDVSEIAKLYGGGGHARAAGFRVPFDQLLQFEINS